MKYIRFRWRNGHLEGLIIRTLRKQNGRVLDARDFGLRGWPIWVRIK
jgi:hypothetical protein